MRLVTGIDSNQYLRDDLGHDDEILRVVLTPVLLYVIEGYLNELAVVPYSEALHFPIRNI
jgi:hypothetical protein